MPAAGGELEQLTNESAEQRGWAWLGDGRSIVFGRRVDSEVRLYYLDVERRTLRDAGLDDAQWPAVSRHGDVLAFVHRRAQFGVFKVPMAGGSAERLFASSGRDGQPMAAPDGRQLVFTSDRSGSFALWWADMQRPDSLRPIEGLRPEGRQAPDWSADSRQLLVVGRRAWAYRCLRDRPARRAPATAAGSGGSAAAGPVRGNPGAAAGSRARCRATHPVEPVRSQRDPWRRLASIDGVSRRVSIAAMAACCSHAWRPAACGRWMRHCPRPACSRSVKTGPADGAIAPGRWRAPEASGISATRPNAVRP